MRASQSMATSNNIAKIMDQWPLVLVAFGGVLTFAWLGLLIWYPLHLLQLV
jgi:hypothetical protein